MSRLSTFQRTLQDAVGRNITEIYGGGEKYAMQNPINLIFTSHKEANHDFLSGCFVKIYGE